MGIMDNHLLQFQDVLNYNNNKNLLSSTHMKKRLSLAYGKLSKIPKDVISHIASEINFLDLSNNEFIDLSFLSEFPQLETLILDRNPNLQVLTFPVLRNLDILWLNNCNIVNIEEWLQKLRETCPILRELSMMCNPVGETKLNGMTDNEELLYRKHIVRILPQLLYFDGRAITDAERAKLKKSTTSLMCLDDDFCRQMKSFLWPTSTLPHSIQSNRLFL